MLSVGFFPKTWWRKTIKKTVEKRYKLMKNLGLLFGLLKPSCVAERVARIKITQLN